MKIDARLTIKTTKGDLSAGQTLEVPVDLDYVSDYDDAIQAIENRIYDDYGVSVFNEVDFTIDNAEELAEELAYDEFKSKTQYTNI